MKFSTIWLLLIIRKTTKTKQTNKQQKIFLWKVDVSVASKVFLQEIFFPSLSYTHLRIQWPRVCCSIFWYHRWLKKKKTTTTTKNSYWKEGLSNWFEFDFVKRFWWHRPFIYIYFFLILVFRSKEIIEFEVEIFFNLKQTKQNKQTNEKCHWIASS